MVQAHPSLEILYELALSIGNSIDLQENLHTALNAYVQKLHCTAGAIFVAEPDPERGYPARLLESIPRPSTIGRIRGYQAALAHPGWSATGLPSRGSTGWDYFYHWFDLPDFGWLLLIRSHQPISQGTQFALLDINRKLATSARLCRENAVDLRESRHLLRNVLDSIPVRVFWKDRDLRYVGCNVAFAADAGLDSPDAVTGKDDRDMPWSLQAERLRSEDREILRIGKPQRLLEELRNTADGVERWVRISTTPLRDEGGLIFGVLGVYEDISEEKESRERIRKQLKEKEALLAEVHHRVFNNLSIIAGLLSLQAGQELTAEDAGRALRNTRTRIESMALVYQNMYRSGGHDTVDMGIYCRETVNTLLSATPMRNQLRPTLQIDAVLLPLNKAIPVALILNELVTNAITHGFPAGHEGELVVVLRNGHAGDGTIVLQVSDNGVGVPEDLDLDHIRTLGLNLVRILADQLRGSLSFRNSETFTIFEVVFS